MNRNDAVRFTPEERLAAQKLMQAACDAGDAEIVSRGGTALKTVVGPVAPDGSCNCTATVTIPPVKTVGLELTI